MNHIRILNQRVMQVEARFADAQKALNANRPSVFRDVLAEGDRVLHPCTWDWILKTAEPPQERDFITRIASLLALHQGWELVGGWREAPRYWWALKGCTFFYGKLNTEGLFYFFQCSRADFDALPRKVQDQAWTEAVGRLTAVLRDPEACQFNKYRPGEARLLMEALSGCNLPELLRPHLPVRKGHGNGSKDALAVWVKAQYGRRHAELAS